MAGEADALIWNEGQRTHFGHQRNSQPLLGFLHYVVVSGTGPLPLDTEQGIFTFVKIIDPDARQAAVALLRRGTVTVSEAAALAGVSRQVVRYWCKVAGIEIGHARGVVVAKAWRKALDGR